MDHHLTWENFTAVDIRIGTIIKAEQFIEAKKPAYKLIIDFGELGLRKTSAQITDLYQPQELIGKQITAVVNFPPKQIANIMSECLVLGAVGSPNGVILISPDRPSKNGLKIS